MQLKIRVYELKLQHTFTISRQSFDTKRTLIVELTDEGYSGYGEASENPFYHISIEKMIEDLQKYKTVIENNSHLTPQDFWTFLYSLFKDNMFALCALDLAYNDLFARKKEKKLFDLWGFSIDHNPLSNYTIGIDSISKMVSKMRETPWPIYKIKLGTNEDLKIVKELRRESDAIFRIDANCAWGVDETIRNSYELKKIGVEFIEQPLPVDNWDDSKEVFLKSALPIIADESCQVEADVDKCYNHFHGINIKLVKCGGLTTALRMLEKAQLYKMKKMVGCMTESSIGISAIAHLLPLLDYVDMDGAMLLKNDIAQGATLNKGIVSYSDSNGIGAKLMDNKPKIILT